MTGTTRSSEGLDEPRRRILFRAWHRGTREMDLVMGRFTDTELDRFSDQDVADFEALIEANDHDIYGWLTGKIDLPPEYDTPVFRRLRAFYAAYSPEL